MMSFFSDGSFVVWEFIFGGVRVTVFTMFRYHANELTFWKRAKKQRIVAILKRRIMLMNRQK